MLWTSFKGVCVEDSIVSPTRGRGRLALHKKFGFLSSAFLSCNVTYRMHRSHLALFVSVSSSGTWGSENWSKKMLVLWLLELLWVTVLSLTQESLAFCHIHEMVACSLVSLKIVKSQTYHSYWQFRLWWWVWFFQRRGRKPHGSIDDEIWGKSMEISSLTHRPNHLPGSKCPLLYCGNEEKLGDDCRLSTVWSCLNTAFSTAHCC